MTVADLAPTDSMLVPRIHRVIAVVDEIPGVVTLRVEPVDGAAAPFLPAQVGLIGAFGVGEATISISSAVEQTDFHEYTIRRAGRTTSALTRMRPGDLLWIRGPFGSAWDLDLDGHDVVVAAGGIGLAPMRAAIYELVRFRERYGHVVLVVGARDSAHLLYRWQYDRWREHGITVIETIDRPEPGWERSIGFVPDVAAGLVAERDLGGKRLRGLICGPDVMIRLTADHLIAAGAPPDGIQVTVERNMQCGTGRCGHCQLGGILVCRDGPAVPYPLVSAAMRVPER